MLSINSGGRLIQKVNNLELIYDLTMITQELMFFKLDTIRFALEMLKELNLIYTDEENVICITNFHLLVGQETGWAEAKRRQHERKQLACVENVHAQVHADVPANIPPEYRDKSIEYRAKTIEEESTDFNDLNQFNDVNNNNDRITLASELNGGFDFKHFKEKEWHIELSHAHIFTRYLVNSKFLEAGNLDTLYDANAFFDSYLRTMYSYEEMKIHVQYFLFQYRKLRKAEKLKITNKLAYLTNAIKKNQRTKEWRSSEEFNSLQKIEETVETNLREEANELYPDDEVRQTSYINKYYLTELGKERKRLHDAFARKRALKS
jgi:hypothetical protein